MEALCLSYVSSVVIVSRALYDTVEKADTGWRGQYQMRLIQYFGCLIGKQNDLQKQGTIEDRTGRRWDRRESLL